MKITILTDNTAGGNLHAEHGISYFIEHKNYELLFDTGHSDLFIKNAEKLGLNLDKIQTIVLSHGHWDHGNGLVHLKNKKLICHPYAFIKRFRKSDNSYIGLNKNWKFYNRQFKIITSTKPYKINDDIIFLGEIPRTTDFEAKTTAYIDEKGNPDFVPDDSAIVIKINDTIAIIAGCSHSGICNITKYAQKITGIEKISLIIGGFHLKKNDTQTQKTIECLQKINPEKIYPSHCTQLPALAQFYNHFKIEQVKTGMSIVIH